MDSATRRLADMAELKSGGAARIKAGSIARWRAPAYVKKVCNRSDPRPRVLRMAFRLVRRLRPPRASRRRPVQA